MNCRIAILFSLAFGQHHGFAQQGKADTVFLAQSAAMAKQSYDRAMVGQSHLYNGPDYLVYNSLDEEHPYLIDDWVVGSVFYDGGLYENVPLLFDLVQDRIVIEHHSSQQSIKLVDNRVEYFEINSRRFVKIRDEEVQDGFYELVYDGGTKFYVRMTKSRQENIQAGKVITYFDEKTFYYVRKGEKFYSVRKKGDVLKVFQDQRAEVKQFVSKNKIKFKQNKKSSIARMTQYYDSITQ